MPSLTAPRSSDPRRMSGLSSRSHPRHHHQPWRSLFFCLLGVSFADSNYSWKNINSGLWLVDPVFPSSRWVEPEVDICYCCIVLGLFLVQRRSSCIARPARGETTISEQEKGVKILFGGFHLISRHRVLSAPYELAGVKPVNRHCWRGGA